MTNTNSLSYFWFNPVAYDQIAYNTSLAAPEDFPTPIPTFALDTNYIAGTQAPYYP
jgi:hypothetical protein